MLFRLRCDALPPDAQRRYCLQSDALPTGKFIGGSVNQRNVERKLTVILSAEVKGYSRLMQAEEMALNLSRYDARKSTILLT